MKGLNTMQELYSLADVNEKQAKAKAKIEIGFWKRVAKFLGRIRSLVKVIDLSSGIGNGDDDAQTVFGSVIAGVLIFDRRYRFP